MNEQLLRRQWAMMGEQNEKIKLKYKKALQQLMNIIKINNSLKEYLNQNIVNRDAQFRNQFELIRSMHTKEIHKYYTQIQQLKVTLNNEMMRCEKLKRNLSVSQIEKNILKQQLQKERYKFNQTVNTQQKSYEIKEEYGKQEQELGCNKQQLQKILEENKLLRDKLLSVYEAIATKDMLIKQIQQLKSNQKQIYLQLITVKQQYHQEILEKEREVMQLKQREEQRGKIMESKYQLLSSELNNYKNIEKYFQQESKSMADQEQIVQNIRDQIQKINQNFNNYEIQSSDIFIKKKDEDARKANKILNLEKHLKESQFQKIKLLQRIQELQKQRLEFNIIKKNMALVQTHNQQILQRNNVLQAMLLTHKHRNNNIEVSDGIKEFQIRMQLMLSDKDADLNECGSFQQTITLKGYIKQLSEELTLSKKRQERLQKKNQNYKKQLSEAEKNFKQKIEEYKNRISNYENLIDKLYRALEQKTKQKLPQQIHKQFNSAISHYEQKMIEMSDQIIRLKTQKQELQGMIKQKQEIEDTVKSMSINMNEIQLQNKMLKDRMKEYNQLSMQKKERNQMDTQEIQKLLKTINQLKQKQRNLQQIIDNSRRELIEHNQQFVKKQKMFSKNEIDRASLIQKANYLQFQLQKQRSKNRDWNANNKLKQEIYSKQRQLQTLTQQINEYQQHIDKLSSQLKVERSNNNKTISDLYVMINEMQNQLTSLQNQQKQNQTKINNYDSLKNENKKLMEQINNKINEKSQISERSNQKIINNGEKQKSNDDMKQSMQNLKKKNQQMAQRSAKQINDLNSQIIILRTNNITLRNEQQSKEDIINELKHQLFTAELKNQREHFNSSIMQQNINKIDNESILSVLVLTFAEVQSLRERNKELEFKYKQDLLKYQLTLKELELKQINLFNSNQHNQHEINQRKEPHNMFPLNNNPPVFFHEGKTSVSSYNLDQIPEQNVNQSFQVSPEVSNMQLGCFSKASSISNNGSESSEKQQIFQK